MAVLSAPILSRRQALNAAALTVAATALPAAARAGELEARFAGHDAANRRTIDHAPFAAFLAPYLVDSPDGITRFRYGAVSADDRAALQAYLASLSAVPVSALARDEQFAFWANLYNALTLEMILEHYPVESIRDIRPTLFSLGPWGKELIEVEGVALTLDNIEHDIMRPIWRDPRVHYAVNCASIGCPNLRPDPFTGAALEQQLEANARAYVNHPRGVSVDGERITASRIYAWFQEDFGDSEAGVLAHLRQYANAGLAEALAGADDIDRYRYDWALNDAS